MVVCDDGCINGRCDVPGGIHECVLMGLLSALDVMNARCDYRSHRLMSVMRMVDGSSRSMKVVDGARSMVMMVVVEMVISCHGFLLVGYYFVFGIFIFYGFWLTIMVII